MTKKKIRRGLITGVVAIMAMTSGVSHGKDVPAGPKEQSWVSVGVQDISRTESGDIAVELLIDLSRVDMKSQMEQVYTPYLYSGEDTVRFESFSVTGHKRLLSNERNNRLVPVTFYKGGLVENKTLTATEGKTANGNGYQITKATAPDSYDMKLRAVWQDWMETATFGIDSEIHGCANCIKNIEGVDNEMIPLAQTDFVERSFFPEFLYVTPVAEAVKMREISARAYIDFVVNRTEINPTYRRNPEELAKIRATIDSVENDKDITIKSLHINGTASPEGSYQNNVRLAKGRTESLKDYVQGLYKFPAGFITTSFEPVDWQGLAEFLTPLAQYKGAGQKPGTGEPVITASDSIRFDQFQNIPGDPALWLEVLPNAANILAIVDSDIEPYARNSKIKTTYPKEYAWLLANVYPALRHSDYRIQFEIKTYTEVSEILEVMEESPQKLSLAELFVAANSQEPGSELYNRAFELAVTMFPSDETANLNAGTAAMQRGDLVSAQRYLNKIKTQTPESRYADAMLLLMQGNEDGALEIFEELSNSPSEAVKAKATAAKEGIESVRKANARKFELVE